MAWLKTFHIVFMVTWFAVLFMLPRLMAYHIETNDPETRAKFNEWERRTYLLGHVAFGLMLLFGYFIYCGILSKKIAAGSNTKTSKWMRLFNEVPAAFLIAIIALVVVKPF